jgi:hypothetical protein
MNYLNEKLFVAFLIMFFSPLMTGCVGEELVYFGMIFLFSPIILGILFRSWRVFFVTFLSSVLVVGFIIIWGNLVKSWFVAYMLVALVPLVGIGYGIKQEFKKG